jgi:hypothetical protein
LFIATSGKHADVIVLGRNSKLTVNQPLHR